MSPLASWQDEDMCKLCDSAEIDRWGHCPRCDGQCEARLLAAYRAAVGLVPTAGSLKPST